MKYSRLVKIAVLSFFILFIIAFVAYRTGAFEKWLNQKSAADQGMEMNTVMANQDISLNSLSVIDSPPVAKRTIMPSSKSMALPLDKSVYLKLDTGLNKVKGAEDTVVFEPYFPSSKSGRLITVPKKKVQK